jgi:hypothetical protein
MPYDDEMNRGSCRISTAAHSLPDARKSSEVAASLVPTAFVVEEEAEERRGISTTTAGWTLPEAAKLKILVGGGVRREDDRSCDKSVPAAASPE